MSTARSAAPDGTVIRIGTRGSDLAMAQTTAIANRIAAAAGVPVELVPITTHGDTSTESLSSLGGTGVFASALREALLADKCDAVVHSLKDLPTAAWDGLVIGAVPKRADARDALCVRTGLVPRASSGKAVVAGPGAGLGTTGGTLLDSLPKGAKVGTGSPRRMAQLREERPDLDVVDIRGNVGTRLGRLVEGDLDGVILAAAGLSRLGLLDRVTEFLELSDWPSAPGQGALAIEVRSGKLDRPLTAALAAISHGTTLATSSAERFVLARLEAGCAAPIGASAQLDDGLLFLTATVYSPDGTRRITSSHAATPESHSDVHLLEAAEDVAYRVSVDLLDGGAAEFANVTAQA